MSEITVTPFVTCEADAPSSCIRTYCEHAEQFGNKLMCRLYGKWYDLTPVTICDTCSDISCKKRGNNVTDCPFVKSDQTAKHDEGKLQIHLVPTQIIRDIAEVRMYGNEKYGDPDNWKNVEKWRYVDALLRHLLLYLDDPDGVDEESGIKHYKHAACNMAFICAMEGKEETKNDSKCQSKI